ncbi:MAG: hypothetical protein RL131_288 [Bacteroidota bacterium]
MRIFLFLNLLLVSIASFAQKNCSSAANFLFPEISSQSNSISENKTIVIPVVIHVVYNTAAENISDIQIQSQLDALNADFSKTNKDFEKVPAVFANRAANVNIRFELAKTDPMGKSTSGIVRKKTSRLMWTDDDKIKSIANGGSTTWDAKSYLNIWVCNTVPGLAGYSTFPGSDLSIDGIVVRFDAFGTTGNVKAPTHKGRTLTHEVGHWLGLQHLWGAQSCGDDGISDTPKQKGGNSGDPVFPKLTSCNGNPDGEMFMNFMDFTNDASMGMFTKGQQSVMRSQFETTGKRASLLQTKAFAPAWNSFAAPEVLTVSTRSLNVYPNPVVVGSQPKLLVNTGYDLNGKHFVIISSNGQVVKSGHVQEMEQELDIHGLKPGIYQVRLTDMGSNMYTKFMVQ